MYDGDICRMNPGPICPLRDVIKFGRDTHTQAVGSSLRGGLELCPERGSATSRLRGDRRCRSEERFPRNSRASTTWNFDALLADPTPFHLFNHGQRGAPYRDGTNLRQHLRVRCATDRTKCRAQPAHDAWRRNRRAKSTSRHFATATRLDETASLLQEHPTNCSCDKVNFASPPTC